MSESIRLDIAITKKLPKLSRASAEKLIESGLVKVNSKVILKPSQKITPEDIINVNLPNQKIAKIDLPVLYEDEDVVVIDKPAGILTHSKGSFNPEPTVASWLSDRYSGHITERSGIVHRLDRLTSGVMICAKNQNTSLWLQKQFSTRQVKKTYVAIVSGHLNIPEAIIDLPIERNPKSPQTFRVGPNGKTAQTKYLSVSKSLHYEMIELRPVTGRTHQLRVHLAHLGHSIVGDNLYKGAESDRLYLHALSLEIMLPSKEKKVFNSKLPKEFKMLLRNDGPAN